MTAQGLISPDVLILLALAGAGLLCLFILALGFIMLGAWVHHKGVSVGSGMNPNFIRSAKGEVFSVQSDGEEFPDGSTEPNEHEQHILGRTSKFMQRFTGGVSDAS